MKFKYNELFRTEYIKRFHLNTEDLQTIVMRPVKSERFLHHGYICTMFLGDRKVNGYQYPLILGLEKNDVFEFQGFYLIPSDIATHPEAENIVFILESFVNRFGLHVTIAGITQKFFYRQDLDISASSSASASAEPILSVRNPDKVSYISTVYLKIVQKTKVENEAQIALAMAVDLVRYERWLLEALPPEVIVVMTCSPELCRG